MPDEPTTGDLRDVLLGAGLAEALIIGGRHEFELHRHRNCKRGLAIELDSVGVVAF